MRSQDPRNIDEDHREIEALFRRRTPAARRNVLSEAMRGYAFEDILEGRSSWSQAVPLEPVAVLDPSSQIILPEELLSVAQESLRA